MWSWLSQISPNVALPIVVGLVGWIWHRAVPSSAQTTVDTVAHQIDSIRSLLLAQAQGLTGKTPADMQIYLRGFAAVELAKLGYKPDDLPPIISAGVDAAVNAAIAWLVTQPTTTTGAKS